MRDSPAPRVAVLTMVRDDETFLRIWTGYYGGLFGRSALTVVAHGGAEMVRDVAAGANVLAIPYIPDPRFDALRWRLLNHLAQGLRLYHDRVIVGDVDELVIADPAIGTLPRILARHPRARALTPFGLELVHRPSEEPAPFAAPYLRARRHVRVAPLYAKPCAIRGQVRLSRGGHYADVPRLCRRAAAGRARGALPAASQACRPGSLPADGRPPQCNGRGGRAGATAGRHDRKTLVCRVARRRCRFRCDRRGRD
ncbi:hypothetical protein [Poseidonocella sp. HB161398]|uniref:hypothetical protein n=1 Tax=Poseidonocella sp. HB161398 TaxID=2320855 RepID=UPI00110817D2|nr:hypothetical protein [Poseidonocella sp. HB161398]